MSGLSPFFKMAGGLSRRATPYRADLRGRRNGRTVYTAEDFEQALTDLLVRSTDDDARTIVVAANIVLRRAVAIPASIAGLSIVGVGRPRISLGIAADYMFNAAGDDFLISDLELVYDEATSGAVYASGARPTMERISEPSGTSPPTNSLICSGVNGRIVGCHMAAKGLLEDSLGQAVASSFPGFTIEGNECDAIGCVFNGDVSMAGDDGSLAGCRVRSAGDVTIASGADANSIIGCKITGDLDASAGTNTHISGTRVDGTYSAGTGDTAGSL